MFINKIKVVSVAIAAAGALLLNSCFSANEPISANINELDQSNWLSMRDAAQDAMSKACNEFYKGLPSAFDHKLTPKDVANGVVEGVPEAPTDSVAWDQAVIDTVNEPAAELTPDQYGLKEKIEALALEAYNTSDTTKLIQFLQDNGLYERYQEICVEYNLDYHAKNLAMRPKEKKLTDDQLFYGGWQAGDVLACYTNSSSGSVGQLGWLIPGKWKHAGFWDKD